MPKSAETNPVPPAPLADHSAALAHPGAARTY
jgi:hypothetical protein